VQAVYTMLKPLFSASFSQLSRYSRRYASSATAFDWKDPLGANNLLTAEEVAVSESAEAYCEERLLPRVLGNG
jgi:glutaryl-CoA dehydrogenase